ncbi:MAG: CBS domain-containing protein [Anaerorhabdus sp.]
MKDNAQRFLSAFIEIEKYLRVLANETRYEKFYRLVEAGSRKNKVVKHYEFHLQEYADLRNAIVHQRDGKGNIIAQPTDEVVAEIEMVLNSLTKCPTVQDFFLKKIYVCYENSLILDVQDVMKKEGYSKVPVVDNRELIGLVHIEDIATWACDNIRGINQDNTIATIIKKDKNNRNTIFVSRKTSVNDIPDIFTHGLKTGKKVDAVFISETGSRKETIIGIITTKDLPLILEYFG